ncbi:hypothetical protein MJO29_008351 [Puccinia striiformis f. sp. tritici]|nr:hypothetical protein MJO29_008351 [Puccinia striiformis f. sp. tritici]
MSGFLQKLFVRTQSCWIQSSITLTRVARSNRLMEAPNKLMPPLSWILVRSSMARSKSDRRIFNSENTDAAAGRRPVASFSSWPSPTSIVNPSLGGSECTWDSPIVVPSAGEEMQMAMVPGEARPASPPYIPYTEVDRAAEDFLADIYQLYPKTNVAVDLESNPRRDPTGTPRGSGAGNGAAESSQFPGPPIVAELLVEGPRRFGAHTTHHQRTLTLGVWLDSVKPPQMMIGYHGVHHHLGGLGRVDPNPESGFIQIFLIIHSSTRQHSGEPSSSFSFLPSIFRAFTIMERIGGTDCTDPVFQRPARCQEFLNDHHGQNQVTNSFVRGRTGFNDLVSLFCFVPSGLLFV